MAWIAVVPPSPRHPHERYQVCYREGTRQRSAGETEAQAALREVQEETGLWCRLGREVGTSAYRDPKRRPKTVRYWEMTPTRGTLGAANEIDDARWVPLKDAPMLLTYEHDRRLLDGWQPAS
jgi:8-oxo-dGTP pyrophosphatase MutT (NUDIX family)